MSQCDGDRPETLLLGQNDGLPCRWPGSPRRPCLWGCCELAGVASLSAHMFLPCSLCTSIFQPQQHKENVTENKPNSMWDLLLQL